MTDKPPMRGFVTDDLPKGINDWRCVYDFCGSMTYRGWRDDANLSADYSPSLGAVHFCGQWRGMKPMVCASEPTEKQVWDYACKQDHVWANRHRAFVARDVADEKRWEQLDQRLAKHGINFANVTYSTPSGETKLTQRVGIMEYWTIFRAATNYLTKLPAGSRLSRFTFRTGCDENGKGGRVFVPRPEPRRVEQPQAAVAEVAAEAEAASQLCSR